MDVWWIAAYDEQGKRKSIRGCEEEELRLKNGENNKEIYRQKWRYL
jgi:hypothetical protein